MSLSKLHRTCHRKTHSKQPSPLSSVALFLAAGGNRTKPGARQQTLGTQLSQLYILFSSLSFSLLSRERSRVGVEIKSVFRGAPARRRMLSGDSSRLLCSAKLSKLQWEGIFLSLSLCSLSSVSILRSLLRCGYLQQMYIRKVFWFSRRVTVCVCVCTI